MTIKKLSPAEDAEAARLFYADVAPGLDVGHLAAMWHIAGLGHLIALDLDRIAGRHGLSSADCTCWARCGSLAPPPCAPRTWP